MGCLGAVTRDLTLAFKFMICEWESFVILSEAKNSLDVSLCGGLEQNSEMFASLSLAHPIPQLSEAVPGISSKPA
jgi:hypothetical protein